MRKGSKSPRKSILPPGVNSDMALEDGPDRPPSARELPNSRAPVVFNEKDPAALTQGVGFS